VLGINSVLEIQGKNPQEPSQSSDKKNPPKPFVLAEGENPQETSQNLNEENPQKPSLHPKEKNPQEPLPSDQIVPL